jgi:4-hydroxy-2-oxovalerate aldolase
MGGCAAWDGQMTERVPEILDTTLRDGSYAIDFQFTADDTAVIASSLESAGIPLIEVGHGLGLGAARAGKGDQAATDDAYLKAAAEALTHAQFGAFFIPGIGSEDDLRRAAACGMGFVRIGTNITELDHAGPFVNLAKALGLRVSCNLMKSYAVAPEAFGERVRMAAEFGADVVCLVDSAGGMLPEEVRRYVDAARNASGVALGFHGHDNLCMGVANTLEAYDAGATVLDGSLQGLGRSEGNAPTEVLAAVFQKRGLLPDVDLNGLLDAAEAFVLPLAHGPRRTAIGITTGRARLHSSFLTRVMATATEFGIDVRDLIVCLGEQNQVDAPAALVAGLARQIASRRPRGTVRVDIASTTGEMPEEFDDEVRARAAELKEKSRKLGLDSVFNVVVGPYELTHVSPFVETGYGCAMTNVMLAEGHLLGRVLSLVDGRVDYVLLDPGGHAVPDDALTQSRLLLYADHEMWARATVSHLTALLGHALQGRLLAVTGVPRLALRAAVALAEAGATVFLDRALENEAGGLGRLCPGIGLQALETSAAAADAVVSLSPRMPSVDVACAQAMRGGAILYDGGIGSVARDAVPVAEAGGVRVVRVDMRPSLAATALELIGMTRIVDTHMGRESWNGVSVVAGGLIGREGEVIVDSISTPSRVIGIADGKGGILRAADGVDAVRRVRQAIAEKRLAGKGRSGI